jgi:hypothetical protein
LRSKATLFKLTDRPIGCARIASTHSISCNA